MKLLQIGRHWIDPERIVAVIDGSRLHDNPPKKHVWIHLAGMGREPITAEMTSGEVVELLDRTVNKEIVSIEPPDRPHLINLADALFPRGPLLQPNNPLRPETSKG